MVPGWGPIYRKKHSQPDGLVALRGLYLTFVFAIAMIGVVVAMLDATGDPTGLFDPVPAAVVVVVVGVVTVVVRRVARRALPCASPSAMAAAYRTRFFLEIAFAEAAALIGFAAFMVTGAGWLYALGAVFSAAGFARLAPTTAHLRRDEEELRRRGCALGLVAALREPPTHT